MIGGDIEPVGLCGSGLVDAVAELVRAGLLEPSGRFVSEEQAASLSPGLARRLVARPDGERIFVLHWAGEEGDADAAVYLSQRDVRELQFGKAAIATGWKLLVEELGIDERDIQQVLLAGSSAPTSRPRARSASASCRSCRARASSPPGTSPARVRRWPCSPSRSAMRRRRW